jgi:outer membrane receptor protein involved in Fe transport
MHKIQLALLAFFICSSSVAQNSKSVASTTVAIRGTVNDAVDQKLLGFATISIMDIGNKIPLQTTVADQYGFFRLTHLPKQPLTLVISYMGYQNKTIDLASIKTSTIDLGKISLSPASTQLQEVQVVAERMLIEQDVDKLIYNVDMDPESHFLNTLELLGRIPFLSLDGDDHLQLNGSDSYLVLVNGKPSSLFLQNPSEVFRSIPANTIKSIEVITSPPARYDAEGVGGIINIITYRKTISGHNGSVNSNISSPVGGTLGSQFAVQSGKINLSTLGGYNLNTSPTANRNMSREDKMRNTQLRQWGQNNMINKGYNFGADLTYEINPLTQITASYLMNKRLGSSFFSQEVNMFNSGGELIQAYSNQNNSINTSGSNDLSFDLHRSFRNNATQQLSLSYRLGRNLMGQFSDFEIDAWLNHTGQISQTENDNQTMEHHFQMDYVHPFKNKQKFEMGFKSVLRNNQSEYFYKNFDPEMQSYLIEERLSNRFEQQQDVHAAYSSLQINKGKWSLRGGFRGEFTQVKANFYTSDTLAFSNYLNFIPNVNIARKLKSNSTFKGSYTQRLERPLIWHINPYINLTDPRNISYGNPNLGPAINHTFNFGYHTFFKKGSINTQFFHNFSNNSIQQYTSIQEDTVAHTTYGNVGKRKVFGFTMGSNFTLWEKFNLNLNSTAQYAEITRQLRNKALTNAGFVVNSSALLSYRINKTWRFNGNLGYTSPQVLLQGRSASFLSNNFSINKQLMGYKGNISLSVRNPFEKYRRFQHEVNDPAFHQIQESFTVIRQYTLSFNYRFGKVQAGQSRRGTASTGESGGID